MSEVIVITSGKGGVGKTTTSANVGTGLAILGKRVVLIDTDIGLRNLDAVSYTHLSLLALGNPGDGLLGLLHHSLDDFMGIKGVGKVKGVQLLCIGELSKRIWKRKASEHALYFGHPEEISDYYMEDMRHLEQEEIRVMFLNTKQAMIRDQIMARGTVNASVMTPREVLDVYKRQERS